MRPAAQKKQRIAWWPVAVIIASACAFCWPVFAGRIMLPADMCLLMLPWKSLQAQFPDFHRPHNPMLDPIQQYLPWRIYAVESLRTGIIPLWNPYAFCGTPFLANLQSTVLYPLNLLFLLTGAAQGFGVSAILHLIIGGLFMYAFLRTIALSPAAGLVGALVLMLNGWVVTWLEYPTLSLWTFMWLPGLLLCYERALRQPRSLWPLFCALALGVQFLGGHLQISAYIILAFALYALVRVISREDRTITRPLAVAIAAIAVLVGLAFAGAQLLPTIELAGQSGRVAHGASAALAAAFPLTHFILYLVPSFFGNPVDYNYWGNVSDPAAFNYFETACYVGILPLFLCLLAFTGKRNWRHAYFGALAALALLAAIGSPLYLALRDLVPGFRELAGLGRVLCLASFAFAGVAALGMDVLLAEKQRLSARFWVLFAAAICLCIAAARVLFNPYIKVLDPGWRFDLYLKHQVAISFGFIVASAVLIGLRARGRLGPTASATIACALVLADLFVAGLRFNPFVDPAMAYPKTDAILWLQEHAAHDRIDSIASDALDWMPHNSPMVFGLRDIHGSDSLRVRRSFELVSGAELAQAKYPPPDSPLLDALGVRYLMTNQPVGENWPLALAGVPPIYENTEALPRAYLAYDMYTGSDADGLATLLAAGRPRPLAVLHDGAGDEPRNVEIAAGATGEPPEAARFLRDAPNEVRIETNARRSAILVLTDSYYPGWRARVYETPTPIVRTNYAFRGVPVGPGASIVTMRYEPATFRVGLFASLLACAALAAHSIGLFLRPPARGGRKRARLTAR
ncbi:MAG: YfhO family protein [Armatimonadota bacterium]